MPLNPRILRQLETLTLESKRKFLGQRHGMHRSIKRGQGLEFSDYRQYELGDNPRHIDWGIYGRSDRLYVKRFLEDQDLSALVVLDASGSMTVRDEGKWEGALSLAQAVAYVALMAQDTIRLVVPGAPVSPRFKSPAAYHAALTFLDDLSIDDDGMRTGDLLVKSMTEAASLLRFPGVALFISDCMYPFDIFANAMTALRARNLEIYVIQVLSPRDLDPLPATQSATLTDRETAEEISVDLSESSRQLYDELLTAHQDAVEKYCHGAQIKFIRALTGGPLEEFVLPTLLKTGLLE